MAIRSTRNALRRLFYQRCFHLFVLLLALVSVAPLIYSLPRGPLITSVINAFTIVSAVAAVGRSRLSFLVVILLAVPALVFLWLSTRTGPSSYYDISLGFNIALYTVTISFLLRYVFDREVMTGDRLSGAAAAYLMIGVLWGFVYTLIDRTFPGSFTMRGTIGPLNPMDLLYFSFTALSTTGLGDIAPITPQARSACTVEMIIGPLFVAILIARLVGVYPPRAR
jgi:hypothetical protein